MKFRKLLTIIAASASLSAAALTTVDEARQKAEDGDVAGAIAGLQELIAAEPKNSEARLLLGELAWSVGEDRLAISTLETAKEQGNREAAYKLVQLAIDSYDIPRANALLESLKPAKKKRSRKPEPTDERAEALKGDVERMENLLKRVEKIAVIDSVVVDADDFLSVYKLSPESGSVTMEDGTVVFMPQSGRQKIWAEEDTAGYYRLMQSDLLFEDQWEEPEALSGNLSSGGDVDYPFQMPDGITLYYASDGEGSLGGYDIFMARRSDNGFLEPVNLGLPYNSPYNDYMMAIDELNGVGWFASDRNRIPGKVTVYMFVPSDIRVNVSADDPLLRQRAMLNPIASTQEPGTDYTAKLEAIRAMDAPQRAEKTDFHISIPGLGVLTSYSQLQNDRARSLAKKYTDIKESIAKEKRHLSELRMRYSQGDKSVSSDIRNLEKRIPELKRMARQAHNAIAEAER